MPSSKGKENSFSGRQTYNLPQRKGEVWGGATWQGEKRQYRFHIRMTRHTHERRRPAHAEAGSDQEKMKVWNPCGGEGLGP